MASFKFPRANEVSRVGREALRKRRRNAVGFNGAFQNEGQVDKFIDGLKTAFEASTRT